MVTVEQAKAVAEAIANEGGVLNYQVVKADGTDYREIFTGATMRQIYAAYALQGISGNMALTHSSAQIAAVAVDLADALILALRAVPTKG